ncbi:DNA-binding protein [Streptomyces murinus]|uniref:Tetratricopeptide (TPR) repeat protein n=1 Tax=Streptomyces murinus TaxID=33900 RepID=A0A7W3NI16_STRMR|nr:DNA-binding protein [Streptomyces murinus]MBA9050901.1 tetratricopeptide (TPR) repeat protein [Streptomyces murinus]WSI89798.1 DNA-binding protein [Streptomyces murinus]
MKNEPRTLLAMLCDRDNLTYRRFDERFTRTGIRLFDHSPNTPTCGETQFRRWTGGKLLGLPGPETCQILEAMWPGYTAEQLFGPPPADDPKAPAFDLEERVQMTAREAHDGADATAAASISDNTIDELRDHVVSLARRYHNLSAAAAYETADQLRREIERQRDRTQVPIQQQTLMILNGQTAALLAVAAFDLGYLPSARTLARTAAVYGESTRFTPLQAYADGTLAYIAYHSGELNEALTKAQRALSLVGLGNVAQRRLHAIAARAYAHLGDVASARRAMQTSEEASPDRRDDLHDAVGGEFGFPGERLAMSNSTSALLMGDAEQAEAEASRALALLGERAQEEQSIDVRAGAAADLAHARLLSDNVDGAADALAPVWEVPPDQRSTGIVMRAARIGRHLARPHFHGAQLPKELREQIEEFTRVSPPYRLGPSVALLAIDS